MLQGPQDSSFPYYQCGTAQFCAMLYNRDMRNVSFSDFRKNASSILDLVEQGEEVEILRHGKVVARLIPAGTTNRAPAWKNPGLRLVTKAPSLTKAILEDRR